MKKLSVVEKYEAETLVKEKLFDTLSKNTVNVLKFCYIHNNKDFSENSDVTLEMLQKELKLTKKEATAIIETLVQEELAIYEDVYGNDEIVVALFEDTFDILEKKFG